MRVYYAAEGAFYLASVGMLLTWEERRRDFPVMALHHVTTCALIAASYYVGCGPCSVVMIECRKRLHKRAAVTPCVHANTTAPGVQAIKSCISRLGDQATCDAASHCLPGYALCYSRNSWVSAVDVQAR